MSFPHIIVNGTREEREREIRRLSGLEDFADPTLRRLFAELDGAADQLAGTGMTTKAFEVMWRAIRRRVRHRFEAAHTPGRQTRRRS
jgi:hypothetical protein